MEVVDILSEQCIDGSLKVASKKQALEALAAKAAKATGIQEREILDVLLERERLGTTGVGSGIAIPHGKLAGLEKLYGCFARLENPIEFDSIDGQPVDLVFLLLAPESAGADHLKALARISRVLRDAVQCDKLRAAPTSGKIFEVLTRASESRAA